MFALINAVVFGFIIYRIYNMGLLPLNPADWIASLSTVIDKKIISVN